MKLTTVLLTALLVITTQVAEAKTVKVKLKAEEANWAFDNINTKMRAYTYDGALPGPVIRVREGDKLEIELTSSTSNKHDHGLEVHGMDSDILKNSAVLKPGEKKVYSFTASTPGVFIYHCGAGKTAKHISRGMFGVVIVDPQRDTRRVADREYVLIQNEFYKNSTLLKQKEYSATAFNGITHRYDPIQDKAASGKMLMAKPGERVRIYIANAGPNFDSVIHANGGIWDKVWIGGSAENPVSKVASYAIAPGQAHVFDMVSPIEGATQILSHASDDSGDGASAYIMFKHILSPAEEDMGKNGKYIVK